MSSSLSARSDVYQTITDRIVEAIQSSAGEFVMPWHRVSVDVGRPTNAASGKRYQGTNIVALWAEGCLSGFGSGYWATYRQWRALGAQVRKGSSSSTIVFFKPLKGGEDEEDEPHGRKLVARASRVFNADQVEGWEAPGIERQNLAESLRLADAFVAGTGAAIRHGFHHACYNRLEDRIELPDRDRFIGTPTSGATESYYATTLHELTHWTGAEHRLKREFGRRFGDEAYAFEELVAELGAAFLCADLGVANEPRADHAAYVAHWLTVLGGDRKAVFLAARLASEAAAYLSKPRQSWLTGSASTRPA
jgi:antirestriction protein ArdC